MNTHLKDSRLYPREGDLSEETWHAVRSTIDGERLHEHHDDDATVAERIAKLEADIEDVRNRSTLPNTLQKDSIDRNSTSTVTPDRISQLLKTNSTDAMPVDKDLGSKDAVHRNLRVPETQLSKKDHGTMAPLPQEAGAVRNTVQDHLRHNMRNNLRLHAMQSTQACLSASATMCVNVNGDMNIDVSVAVVIV